MASAGNRVANGFIFSWVGWLTGKGSVQRDRTDVSSPNLLRPANVIFASPHAEDAWHPGGKGRRSFLPDGARLKTALTNYFRRGVRHGAFFPLSLGLGKVFLELGKKI